MKEHRIQTRLMGSQFELIIHHQDPVIAEKMLNLGVAEIKRIEDLLSEFRENTITSKINHSAGDQFIYCGMEVYGLLQRCCRISLLTQGAFDITVGPLKKIYRFKNSDFQFPEQETINLALADIGFGHISFSDNEYGVKLNKQGMSISFAAIGKGYAADRVRQLWLENNICSGVISASGDLTTIGHRFDGSPWKIGIADPDNTQNVKFYLTVTNAAVATSGDYEQNFIHKGIRYSHNINPKTGVPCTGIKSVSIISPAAELSDALSTAVYIMGPETGLHLVDQLPDTHCIIIDSQNKIYRSKNIEIIHEN